jgi:argininosuccinate synthase
VSSKKDVIVLAYAGGLETSVALAWLADQYQADVVTLTLDLGQATDLSDVRDQALAIGAVRAHVIDVRDELARTAVTPALKHGCDQPRVAALSRPLIGRQLARVADIEGTATVAHGSLQPVLSDSGMDAAILDANEDLHVLAPCRDWDLSLRAKVEFAQARGIPVPPSGAALTSVRSLWGRALSGDLLSGPWTELPPEAFLLTCTVADWPKTPATLVVEFDEGVPTSLNGVAMPLVELLASLETVAGAHGVGRLDFPAIDRVRPRIVEEAPGPVVLHQAMKALATAAPETWPAVHGRVTLTCSMGECRIDECRVEEVPV